jgi:hypothetical protein
MDHVYVPPVAEEEIEWLRTEYPKREFNSLLLKQLAYDSISLYEKVGVKFETAVDQVLDKANLTEGRYWNYRFLIFAIGRRRQQEPLRRSRDQLHTELFQDPKRQAVAPTILQHDMMVTRMLQAQDRRNR